MTNLAPLSPFREKALNLFYRLAVSGALPVSWFRDVDPATVVKAKKTGKLKLEIVSHCWRYGHFLNYQLSSLVNHRTDKFDITMTVFHVADDDKVVPVLDYFGRMEVPGVTWNWQALPKEELFRRGIGRNIAAKQTRLTGSGLPMPTLFSTRAAWIRWPTFCRVEMTDWCTRVSALERPCFLKTMRFWRRENKVRTSLRFQSTSFTLTVDRDPRPRDRTRSRMEILRVPAVTAMRSSTIRRRQPAG